MNAYHPYAQRGLVVAAPRANADAATGAAKRARQGSRARGLEGLRSACRQLRLLPQACARAARRAERARRAAVELRALDRQTRLEIGLINRETDLALQDLKHDWARPPF
ncbi:MAG: hypothetical protein QNJ94_08990 [Alphaproteobacteria bacterium]|nr:hypothetical protein [Alphaproteobacteria bacterium]